MTTLAWKERKDKGTLDIANLIMGALLFLSPWLFGFVPETAASWNAWIFGAVIVALAAAALYAFAEWEGWVNLALGIWVLVAPWLLGFAYHAAAMWTHVVLGLIVAILSAADVWTFRHSPPRVTA